MVTTVVELAITVTEAGRDEGRGKAEKDNEWVEGGGTKEEGFEGLVKRISRKSRDEEREGCENGDVADDGDGVGDGEEERVKDGGSECSPEGVDDGVPEGSDGAQPDEVSYNEEGAQEGRAEEGGAEESTEEGGAEGELAA